MHSVCFLSPIHIAVVLVAVVLVVVLVLVVNCLVLHLFAVPLTQFAENSAQHTNAWCFTEHVW